jgi:hypothetical protein
MGEYSKCRKVKVKGSSGRGVKPFFFAEAASFYFGEMTRYRPNTATHLVSFRAITLNSVLLPVNLHMIIDSDSGQAPRHCLLKSTAVESFNNGSLCEELDGTGEVIMYS